jgi:hypothetical protein
MLPLAIRLPLLRFSRLSVGPVLIILAFRALIARVAPVVVLLQVLAPRCLVLRMRLQALAAAAAARPSTASPNLLVILVKRASAWALPVVVVVQVLVLECWSEGGDTIGIWRKFGQNHENSHRGERPYECPECGKASTRMNDCKRHQKLHERGK